MDFNTTIERTGTNCYKWDMRRDVFGTNDVMPLSVADMDLPSPLAVTEALLRRAQHPVYGYAMRPDAYYQAAIGWYARRFGWRISRQWMLDTPGVVPALSLAVQAFSRPGEGVVIQTPVYHPFFAVIHMQEREVVPNPLVRRGGTYEMDLDHLERQLARPDVNLMLLCSPHNPVGRVWSETELRAVATLCARHDVVLVSDDIHADIVYPGHRHIPLATLGTGAKLLTCVAPSKTFNVAGLVTALLVTEDEDLRERFRAELYRYGLWMGNIFGIEALQAAYDGGEDWLEELLVYLHGNLDLLQEWLPGRVPGVKLLRPQGTYVAWLDCRGLALPQDELMKLFVQRAHVGLDNGTNFGPDGQGYMRINFALPRPRLLQALQQIQEAVQKG